MLFPLFQIDPLANLASSQNEAHTMKEIYTGVYPLLDRKDRDLTHIAEFEMGLIDYQKSMTSFSKDKTH